MSKSQEAPAITSIRDFVFETPLYAKCLLPSSLAIYRSPAIDGHCPYCKSQSTFGKMTHSMPDGIIQFSCARNISHTITIYIRMEDGQTYKIGQEPSFADIMKDDVSRYKKVLRDEDIKEFRRAIGLAAAGIGIGSFVYLRRIFERLVYSRFRQEQVAQGWNIEEFSKLRMEDKIKYLRGHLPDFMVENAQLYGILSKGVHELSEDECLKYFSLVKSSIVLIIDEDFEKKQKEALRKSISSEISKLAGSLKREDQQS